MSVLWALATDFNRRSQIAANWSSCPVDDFGHARWLILAAAGM